MTTSIIIPCYFASEELVWMTSACLESLKKYGAPDEVIVVDDGSPLDVEGFVQELPIRRHTNGGYAAAVNTGLKQASGEVLIVSNNDIIFTPGWLEAILKPLQDGYDISSIRTSDNGWETEEKITEGDKFGSLWAMKRRVYEELGGLDEGFGKGYFEDTDFRRRALETGFKIAKNHGHLVEHFGKSTFKVVDPEDKHYYQAMTYYKDKHGEVD